MDNFETPKKPLNKPHTQQRGRELALIQDDCDFLASGWHLDTIKEKQSFGQQTAKRGNVSNKQRLHKVLCNTECDCHVQ